MFKSIVALILVVGILAAAIPKKQVYTFKDLNTEEEEIETEYKDNVTVTIDGEQFTPYEVAIWHLKTSEGFSPTPYPDGDYQSCAFGYNFVHGPVPTPISWDDGTVLLANTFDSMKKSVKKDKRFTKVDEWQKSALGCRFYNGGPGCLPSYDEPKDLLGCHGKSVGCGYVCKDKKLSKVERLKRQQSVRAHHSKRREFEYNMFMKNFEKLNIKALRQKCIELQNGR